MEPEVLAPMYNTLLRPTLRPRGLDSIPIRLPLGWVPEDALIVKCTEYGRYRTAIAVLCRHTLAEAAVAIVPVDNTTRIYVATSSTGNPDPQTYLTSMWKCLRSLSGSDSANPSPREQAAERELDEMTVRYGLDRLKRSVDQEADHKFHQILRNASTSLSQSNLAHDVPLAPLLDKVEEVMELLKKSSVPVSNSDLKDIVDALLAAYHMHQNMPLWRWAKAAEYIGDGTYNTCVVKPGSDLGRRCRVPSIRKNLLQ